MSALLVVASMNLDLAEIRNAIRDFNSKLPYCAQDFIVHELFQEEPSTRDQRRSFLSIRVEALASLFRATYADANTRHSLVTREFVDYYWDFVNRNTNRLTDLSEDTRLFSEMLGKVDQLINRNEGVFVSKLLHWSFTQVFPMMDSRSYGAMANRSDGSVRPWHSRGGI